MSEGTVIASELTSQYLNQVAGDLERNVKEQERITVELTELQQQLDTLQHDHTVLVSMQQALGAGTPVTEPAKADSPTVPSPRKKTTAASGTRRPAKKANAEQPKAKKRSVTKPAAKETAAAKTGTTLVGLIHSHLTDQSEPRSAAEVAEALGRVHPGRNIKTTVVRTTLENLVAKSQVQRTKQGNSVFYTAAIPSEPNEPTAAATDEVQSATA
ncbi:BlaI/MecI/CopY family transcriptional regulator [Streptomyces sp. NPDC101151]|uniref:BlaI/MecI/CopY family transcriptional regulator n=1 Tax=Streptomyces sp. NPDC101151 TaxID=3366115 RepID=UPI003811EB41